MCKYDNVDLIVIKTENKIDFVKNVKFKKKCKQTKQEHKTTEISNTKFQLQIATKKKDTQKP